MAAAAEQQRCVGVAEVPARTKVFKAWTPPPATAATDHAFRLGASQK